MLNAWSALLVAEGATHLCRECCRRRRAARVADVAEPEAAVWPVALLCVCVDCCPCVQRVVLQGMRPQRLLFRLRNCKFP